MGRSQTPNRNNIIIGYYQSCNSKWCNFDLYHIKSLPTMKLKLLICVSGKPNRNIVTLCLFITKYHQKHHGHHVYAELILEDEDNHFHRYHRYVFVHVMSSYANCSCLSFVVCDHIAHKRMVLSRCELIHELSISPFQWNLCYRPCKRAFDVSLGHAFLCGFVN